MKFVVVGLGSIGKRHVKNLIKSGVKPQNITGIDPRQDRIHETKKLFKITETFTKVTQLDKKYDAAIICSPTSYHIKQSITLAKKNINIFIEKPLNHNLNKINELKRLVEKNNIKVLITYPFRFSKHGLKLKELVKSRKLGKIYFFRGIFSEYLPDWHPWENYTKFYMAKKSLGGGSLLDQSHLIDMCHFLFGEAKSIYGCINSRVSDLKVETDDLVNMNIKFKNGVIGNIHQDMFGRKHQKNLEIFCKNGNIFWNVYDLSVQIYNAKTKKIKKYIFNKDHNKMYEYQTKHMIKILRNEEKPAINLHDGIHTMKIIEAAIKSNKLGKTVKI